jgi:hypothetical protein
MTTNVLDIFIADEDIDTVVMAALNFFKHLVDG